MPDRKYDLKLPVKGELNTALPIGDLPPGTLVAASDVASDSWGVRRGDRRFTGIWEGPGTGSLYDGVQFTFASSGAKANATSYEDAFRDLGLQWTLDLWLRVEDTTGQAAADSIGLYHFEAGTGPFGQIDVIFRGPHHADHEKIFVSIKTSASRTSADIAVTFTGSTRLVVGTTQAEKYHIRIVRNAGVVTLYVNGVQDGQSSSYSTTHPIYAALGAVANVNYGSVYIGGAVGVFVGRIYGGVLRDGAFDQAPIEAIMPHNPWARNVRHYHLGRNFSYSSGDHLFDAGRFQVHARLLNNVGSDYNITSAVDNAAPAPASVQGIKTWTSRSNRTLTSVAAGGILSTALNV